MINITLGVDLGSPNMKYPKNGFKIINITQIPEMNPARGFCFIRVKGPTVPVQSRTPNFFHDFVPIS